MTSACGGPASAAQLLPPAARAIAAKDATKTLVSVHSGFILKSRKSSPERKRKLTPMHKVRGREGGGRGAKRGGGGGGGGKQKKKKKKNN